MQASSTLSAKFLGLLNFSLLLGLALVFSSVSLAKEQTFFIEDLHLEGLQRVSPGTIFAELNLDAETQLTLSEITQASKKLYELGLFEDLAIYQDGNQLILQVQERPTLEKLKLEGYKKLSKDDLENGLKQVGLEEGQIFQKSTLDQIQLELERMYHAQGRYNASIKSEVINLGRNRVEVKIKINEGSVAAIKRVNFVGNKDFNNQQLAKRLELEQTRGWTLFSSADQYSREKLGGDLERLTSWYLDRGYLRFNVESTQVAINPNKQDIFVTLNLHEGDQYTVSEVGLSGDLILTEAQLMPFILLKAGDTFSRSAMTSSSEGIRNRLGIEGYTFAEVHSQPQIDDTKKEVKLNFIVNPGRRSYVRRINFDGNTSTNDEVLRREMLQLEGASANTNLIRRSKQRLERLGYFSQVEVETLPVAGSPDLIDINYTVKEQPSGSISASLGYSQASGVVYGANISQSNFLGTGNTASLGANKSDWRTSYNFSYHNPYYTLDGVSRGFNAFYRKTDFEDLDLVADYATDAYGANVTYGYPITTNSRISLSLGFDDTKIAANKNSDGTYQINEIQRFSELTNGEMQFFNYKLTGRWTRNLLNRGILATAGNYQSLSLELATPGSDYTFYKVNYRGQKYFPLSQAWSLRFKTDLGYGDGFGDYKQLPLHEHYYAGGLSSVRGYRTNSLGPRSSIGSGANSQRLNTAIGGNILIEAGVELIFPLPFMEDQSSIQTTLFIDGGNVFTNQCLSSANCKNGIHADEMRYAAGISLTWLTAIGPLAFSFATPINEKSIDRTEFFQFSLGQTF